MRLFCLMRYTDHKCVTRVELKAIGFLLGQESVYAKYPCFLWLWVSHAIVRHCFRYLCGALLELRRKK